MMKMRENGGQINNFPNVAKAAQENILCKRTGQFGKLSNGINVGQDTILPYGYALFVTLSNPDKSGLYRRVTSLAHIGLFHTSIRSATQYDKE